MYHIPNQQSINIGSLAFGPRVKVQLYNKNNNKCNNLYHIMNKQSINITSLAFGPWFNMRCDTCIFDMYYSLFILFTKPGIKHFHK